MSWNGAFRDIDLISPKILRMMPEEERKRLGKAGLTPEEHQAKTDAKRERELHDRIEALLRIRGITYVHSRMDKPSTIRVGLPDFMFCLPREKGFGIPMAIEVKMPGEEPTPEQVQCMRELIRDGWFVRVVRNEQQFIQALQEAEVQ